MTILLAGSTGFLGRHVLATLQSAGHTVHKWTRGFCSDYFALNESDIYINCAGNTEDSESMYGDNVHLTMEMLEAARSFRKRFIHVGSIVEDLPGDSVYQVTKRAATQLCLAYSREWKVQVAVAQLSTIYGVGDREGAFLPTLWRSHVQKTAFRPTNEFRGWVHVKDAAEAISLIAGDFFSSGIYPINSDYLHNLALCDIFKKRVGEKLLLDLSSSRDEGLGWPRHSCEEVRNLGWIPKHDIEYGIGQFVTAQQSDEVWLGAEA